MRTDTIDSVEKCTEDDVYLSYYVFGGTFTVFLLMPYVIKNETEARACSVRTAVQMLTPCERCINSVLGAQKKSFWGAPSKQFI